MAVGEPAVGPAAAVAVVAASAVVESSAAVVRSTVAEPAVAAEKFAADPLAAAAAARAAVAEPAVHVVAERGCSLVTAVAAATIPGVDVAAAAVKRFSGTAAAERETGHLLGSGHPAAGWLVCWLAVCWPETRTEGKWPCLWKLQTHTAFCDVGEVGFYDVCEVGFFNVREVAFCDVGEVGVL